MSRPRVSVIMAARDYAVHLPAALASVQSQTMADWECIVIDDASADDTPEIVAKAVQADSRIRSIRNTTNHGVSVARNQGLAVAQGDFVQFLDADDAIAPGKLERHAAFLDAHGDAALVLSDFVHFTVQPDFQAPGELRAYEKLDGPGKAVLNRLLKGNTVRINTALVRTSAIRQIGGFKPEFLAVEDWHLWLRLAAGECRFSFLDDRACQSAVRVNPRGLSKDAPGMRRYHLPVMQDIWCRMQDPPISLLLRYADFLLEMLLMKRERVVLLADQKPAFLIRIVPLSIALLPFWLLFRPWRLR